MTDYDEQRRKNIANARLLLEELGYKELQLKPKSKPKPHRNQKLSKKRGRPRDDQHIEHEENDEEPPHKLVKVLDADASPVGLRRSARNRGAPVDYTNDGEHGNAAARALPRVVSALRAGMQGAPRDANKRKYDPKTYGSIPGISIGSWWESRQACSTDAVHAPWVAGISAGPKGAYSVALSGGYEDDIDLGEAFTFTGSGGRDLKGTKNNPKNLRTAPQSSDQSFDNVYNRALLRSSETKKPVRVIRGFKLDSSLAPSEGYRYDGLYTVERAWMETGLNPGGYQVCKFALKRVPGQPPLQYGDDDEDDDEEEQYEDEDDA